MGSEKPTNKKTHKIFPGLSWDFLGGICLCVFPLLNVRMSESVSTGVWCVPGFGAGFEIALEPSELQKEGENPEKGHFYFLCQTLVCTKSWFKRDLKISRKKKKHKHIFDPRPVPGQSRQHL